MTVHPNIIAGALREAAVLVTANAEGPFDVDSKSHCDAYRATFEFLLRCVGDSEVLAEADYPGAVEVPAPNPDPFPAPQPQVAAPAPQAAPQPPPQQYAPAPQSQAYQQPQAQQYAQPAALPQQAPPPPASISPNSSEDELWAALIAEFQANGRLISWVDKRQTKGPNGRGADFAHANIQKQGKDGKWWPLGLWINNRTPGWVLPALQQAGLG